MRRTGVLEEVETGLWCGEAAFGEMLSLAGDELGNGEIVRVNLGIEVMRELGGPHVPSKLREREVAGGREDRVWLTRGRRLGLGLAAFAKWLNRGLVRPLRDRNADRNGDRKRGCLGRTHRYRRLPR